MSQRNIPNLRRDPSGVFWLPRRNREAEDYLDLTMDRVPGQLKWYPKMKSELFSEIYDLIRGKEVNIVGKGPSLDKLTDLGGRYTFAINEAVHHCEKLDPELTIGITQDANLKDTCKPKAARLIINQRICSWYEGVGRLWVMSPAIFGEELTAIMAIRIAASGGATAAHMLCFDACTNGNLGYASVIGYQSNAYGAPSRFLSHRARIEKHSTLPLHWSESPSKS